MGRGRSTSPSGSDHYAHPSTQSNPAKHGLRILHRTTVEGDARPSK